MKTILQNLFVVIRDGYLSCTDAMLRCVFNNNERVLIEYTSDECTKVRAYGMDMCKVNPAFHTYMVVQDFYNNIPVDKMAELMDDAMPSYQEFKYIIKR